MRFEVSRVMDTIEQRLTTDVTLAQAVVDLADVARFEKLDGGRRISLLRVGMVLDALARYLVDGAALLYPVAGRELLTDGDLTSKERMVLGRWIDDGRIEATPMVGDRVVEIADFTGMPVISCRDYRQYAERFPWVRDQPERILRLSPRPGKAGLGPSSEVTPSGTAGSGRAVAAGSGRAVAKFTAPGQSPPPDRPGDGVFSPRVQASQTRVSTRAIEPPAEPSSLGSALLARYWRCPEPDCPSFGEYRRAGQPVPRMLKGMPVCPRHAQSLTDRGTRPAEYPVAVVIDDVVRQRFPVTATGAVRIGGAAEEADDYVSLAVWLHEGAAGWIADRHATLDIVDGRLTVTDLGENGTVVWKRTVAGGAGESLRLYPGQTYQLGPHDSVELYTGVELVPGNRRVVGGPLTAGEVRSVLADAPTVALRAHSSRG